MNALTGNTRLRVQTTGSTTLPDVCGSFSMGETEDYCASIESVAVGIAGHGPSPLTITPNPAGTFVTVSGLAIGQSISVLSIDGRMMMEGQATGTSASLDVSNWPKGTYLVRVMDDARGLRHTRLVVM
ncbi:MAG: T9SS type A sorting domain-containing protein [Flavobacteriales bacterium]|nr:T9SS type A sorting domain-containing protein [Flavobacteriales bacterium]